MRIGRLARWYRWIEYAAFGHALERIRFAHLNRIADARRVLILGEGDGRTLARLLEIAPHARFEVFDVSPQMIALAKHRTSDRKRVAFHCRDARAENWPARSYDALVTQFFLDCLTEHDARTIVSQLNHALAPGGIWLLAEFAVPTSGWRKIHAQLWVSAMYRFFRAASALQPQSLPPIGQLLTQAGLHREERTEARAGLMISEIWRKP